MKNTGRIMMSLLCLLILSIMVFLPWEANADLIITTVAGNGTKGYSGDNGQATAAMLNYPGEGAVDSSGNIYIAGYI